MSLQALGWGSWDQVEESWVPAPLQRHQGKTFSGLGTVGTSTEGSQTLPVSLNFMDSQCTPVHGVLETHQLSTGKWPLLLSLHAQAHLGLVKDFKNGTVSIDGNQLPVLRCSHTRLMMLAITPNQLDLMGRTFHNSSQQIPKCHRNLELHSPLFQTRPRRWMPRRLPLDFTILALLLLSPLWTKPWGDWIARTSW